MSDQQPIGLFDSGIGGLTVLKELQRIFPFERYVYLADTLHLPYGTKTKQEVVSLSLSNLRFLSQFNLKALVIACNTASAWGYQVLQKQAGFPIFNVINPAAEAAFKASKSKKIGVMATSSTIRSRAYYKALKALHEDVNVVSQACPMLVPLVESECFSFSQAKPYLEKYLSNMLTQGVDTIILGCTHYPLLKPYIQDLVGDAVELIDSATCLAQCLKSSGLTFSEDTKGSTELYVTSNPQRFNQKSQALSLFSEGSATHIAYHTL